MTKRILATLALAAALGPVAGRAGADPFVGLTTVNQLFTFDSSSPGTISGLTPVAGLLAGTTLVGIDFRPIDGQLVGVGAVSTTTGAIGTVYEINPLTGAASIINTGFALTGTRFGVDFNPVPNALRIVSDADQNLRITLGGAGVVNVDGTLNPGNPNVVGSAYNNNFAGTATTTLYGIDSSTNQLFIQNPPNDGTLVLVGALGLDVTDVLGFDIAGPGPSFNTAFAALQLTAGGGSGLYTIDLGTGQATFLGAIGGGTVQVLGLSAAPVPEPGSLTLLGLGAIGLAGYRWRRRQLARRPG